MKPTPLLVLCVAASLLPGCVAASRHYQVVDELDRALSDLALAEDELHDMEADMMSVSGSIDLLEEKANRVDALEVENMQLHSELMAAQEQARSTTPEGFEFVINEREGLYGYAGEGDVFFASGRAELTDEGKAALRRLAPELQQAQKPIRIVGHTDTDPINKSKDLWPEGNFQLGSGRALSVMKFLVEEGLAEKRFAVMSYGQHRPREAGKSAEAKQRNRRVEIMVEAFQPSP